MSAPIILLIGGLAMMGAKLEPLRQMIAQSELEAVYLDNLRIGSTPRGEPDEVLTIGDQARHQWKNIDELHLTPDRPIIIFGISMGGMIAAEMVAQRPEAVA